MKSASGTGILRSVRCSVDGSGAETACCVVTIDEKNDDVVIVTAQS